MSFIFFFPLYNSGLDSSMCVVELLQDVLSTFSSCHLPLTLTSVANLDTSILSKISANQTHNLFSNNTFINNSSYLE